MKATSATVDKAVPSPKTSRFRWVILTLVFLLYTIANADRANLGVALPFIRKEFPMTNTEAGMLISLFFAFYAIMQIPVSFLYKKFGARTLMSASMLFTSLATWCIGTSSSILHVKIFRALLGVSEAPLPIGCSTIIDRWFPPKEKGTATGIYWAASKFGPVICPPICVLIIQLTGGWREIFFFFAAPGIIFSILWFFLVRNYPEESPLISKAELAYIQNKKAPDAKVIAAAATTTSYYPTWLDKIIRIKKLAPLDTTRKVFTSWNIMANAFSWLCMVGIVNVIMAWIPTYLLNEKHFTTVKMGSVSTAPFIGAVLGNMVGGWLSDRVFKMRRKPLMMVSALSTSIMMYSLIYAPNNPLYLAIMLFLAGFMLSLGYSAFTVYPMGLASKEAFPVAISVVNTGGSLGSTIFPTLAGMILDSYSWSNVFMFLAACSILCLIVISTMDEPLPEGETIS
ncbi:MAG: MFS transporter [Sporomusa sp.]